MVPATSKPQHAAEAMLPMSHRWQLVAQRPKDSQNSMPTGLLLLSTLLPEYLIDYITDATHGACTVCGNGRVSVVRPSVCKVDQYLMLGTALVRAADVDDSCWHNAPSTDGCTCLSCSCRQHHVDSWGIRLHTDLLSTQESEDQSMKRAKFRNNKHL